jgi:hypothetical protein
VLLAFCPFLWYNKIIKTVVRQAVHGFEGHLYSTSGKYYKELGTVGEQPNVSINHKVYHRDSPKIDHTEAVK